MRKWLLVGLVTVAVGCVGGYWFFLRNSPPTESTLVVANDWRSVLPNGKGGGAAEESEVIEPLVVDRGPCAAAPSSPPRDDGPMPRVEWASGMKQPPRPDAEPGRVLRMPYADEEDFLDLRKDPVTRILESDLPPLNLFDEIDKGNPAEEAEPTEPVAPAFDPHEQHCPYHGGCPAPYPYRMTPRQP